ncbi:MAG: formylglycine-generating enzyme family protein [Pseudomonas sp.]
MFEILILKLSASVAIIFLLAGCDGAPPSNYVHGASRLAEKSLTNMVVVDGGEFLMGDFGPLVGEMLPFTRHQDDKKLHKVILDDFMISKYKVTYEDYEVYRATTGGRKLIVGLSKSYPKIIEGNVSVSVTWQQAKDYCLWLGEKTGKNVNLPSEAQWEFAARSRGQYLPFATDDGTFDEGRNVPSGEQKVQMIGTSFPYYPIGLYPPNPLGLYDMGLSGSEWAGDWYAEDYYSHSPVVNPQGPNVGVAKVRRGYTGGDTQLALTMYRRSAPPIPVTRDSNYELYGITPSYVFRCAINGERGSKI